MTRQHLWSDLLRNQVESTCLTEKREQQHYTHRTQTESILWHEMETSTNACILQRYWMPGLVIHYWMEASLVSTLSKTNNEPLTGMFSHLTSPKLHVIWTGTFWILGNKSPCSMTEFPVNEWGHYVLIDWIFTHCTLSRKSLNCFVSTNPRGCVVITKPLASRMSLCAKELTLFLLTVFLCKYTKVLHVLWLCKSKLFHNSFLRVWPRICSTVNNESPHSFNDSFWECMKSISSANPYWNG